MSDNEKKLLPNWYQQWREDFCDKLEKHGVDINTIFLLRKDLYAIYFKILETLPCFRWVEINPRPLPELQKLPEIGVPVLWKTEEGQYFVREIAGEDDYDWWNGDIPGLRTTKCSHWSPIEWKNP